MLASQRSCPSCPEQDNQTPILKRSKALIELCLAMLLCWSGAHAVQLTLPIWVQAAPSVLSAQDLMHPFLPVARLNIQKDARRLVIVVSKTSALIQILINFRVIYVVLIKIFAWPHLSMHTKFFQSAVTISHFTAQTCVHISFHSFLAHLS